MGCDIHMIVEHFYYRYDETTGEDLGRGWRFTIDEEGTFGDRNYTLFSILAGVRDYSGKVKPIAKPRGLPKDADPRTIAWRKAGGADLHSVSYVTLREVLQYPWAKPIPEAGFVDPVNAARVFAGEEPQGWCQGRSGIEVTPAEMKRLLKKHPIPKKVVKAADSFGSSFAFDRSKHPLANHFTSLEWGSLPRCDNFLEWVKSLRHTGLGRNAFEYDKPELRKDPSKSSSTNLSGNDVRFVFAFDN